MPTQPNSPNQKDQNPQSQQSQNNNKGHGIQPRQMGRNMTRDLTRFHPSSTTQAEKDTAPTQLEAMSSSNTLGERNSESNASGEEDSYNIPFKKYAPHQILLKKSKSSEITTENPALDGAETHPTQLKEYPPHQITQKTGKSTEGTTEKPASNNTGLPDDLKSGIENLSGYSMDDVQVHHNSDKPAQLNAHAYAQGTDIHLGSGQEKHLPHEAWHVVQQKQGRVKPTMQMKGGVNVNDDKGLEKEADVMGERALNTQIETTQKKEFRSIPISVYQRASLQSVVQLIYLWDRSSETNPHWSDDAAPNNYLPSGKHDDEIHGEDDLYERMGGNDLFYGINYEDSEEFLPFLEALQKISKNNGYDLESSDGLVQSLAKYEEDGSNPVLDVEVYKAIFGGSSGWDKYTLFLSTGKQAGWSSTLKELNPGLKWAENDLGLACQVAIIKAISVKGSVRFLLDGMSNVRGILAGTAYQENVTSEELIYTNDIIGKTITLPDKSTIQPQDGVNVFFYLNRQQVQSDLIYLLNKDSTQTLARRLAEKIAEEEEWNELEEEVQQDIYELKSALQGLLSIPQIIELLSLP